MKNHEKALQIEPENADAFRDSKAAYYYRGVDAYRAGDLDKPLKNFDRILEGIARRELYDCIVG